MANKHLYLLRHAQTLERQGDQADIDRELTTIGLQNSTRMGINFMNKDYHFDMIITSSANRALRTSHLIAEQIKYDTDKVFINDQVYDASVRNILSVVNNFKEDWTRVLLVGHNPTISYLGEYLGNSDIGDMTTCGVLHIKFNDLKWSSVGEDTGIVQSYEYPDLLNF